MNNIVAFGIIPSFKEAQPHAIGNGSLAGAMACLLSQEIRKKAHDTSWQKIYFVLLVDVNFTKE